MDYMYEELHVPYPLTVEVRLIMHLRKLPLVIPAW